MSHRPGYMTPQMQARQRQLLQQRQQQQSWSTSRSGTVLFQGGAGGSFGLGGDMSQGIAGGSLGIEGGLSQGGSFGLGNGSLGLGGGSLGLDVGLSQRDFGGGGHNSFSMAEDSLAFGNDFENQSMNVPSSVNFARSHGRSHRRQSRSFDAANVDLDDLGSLGSGLTAESVKDVQDRLNAFEKRLLEQRVLKAGALGIVELRQLCVCRFGDTDGNELADFLEDQDFAQRNIVERVKCILVNGRSALDSVNKTREWEDNIKKVGELLKFIDLVEARKLELIEEKKAAYEAELADLATLGQLQTSSTDSPLAQCKFCDRVYKFLIDDVVKDAKLIKIPEALRMILKVLAPCLSPTALCERLGLSCEDIAEAMSHSELCDHLEALQDISYLTVNMDIRRILTQYERDGLLPPNFNKKNILRSKEFTIEHLRTLMKTYYALRKPNEPGEGMFNNKTGENQPAIVPRSGSVVATGEPQLPLAVPGRDFTLESWISENLQEYVSKVHAGEFSGMAHKDVVQNAKLVLKPIWSHVTDGQSAEFLAQAKERAPVLVEKTIHAAIAAQAVSVTATEPPSSTDTLWKAAVDEKVVHVKALFSGRNPETEDIDGAIRKAIDEVVDVCAGGVDVKVVESYLMEQLDATILELNAEAKLLAEVPSTEDIAGQAIGKNFSDFNTVEDVQEDYQAWLKALVDWVDQETYDATLKDLDVGTLQLDALPGHFVQLKDFWKSQLAEICFSYSCHVERRLGKAGNAH